MLPLLLALVLPVANAFYLPGAAPKDYRTGEDVELDVNSVTPGLGYDEALVRSLISYDYYQHNFHFCKPDVINKKPESLGSIIFGDRIFNSPFKINMLVNDSCHALCDVTVPGEDAKFINERIQEDYTLNFLVDGLPAAEMKKDINTDEVFYDTGVDLGDAGGHLHNHFDLVLKYHKRGPDQLRVVGVLVWPSSIRREETISANPTCSTSLQGLKLSEDKDTSFYYTYSITWEESDTAWATRWDNYLKIWDSNIHTFSLMNSIVMVMFLCGVVSTILLRNVNRDIHRYNAIDLDEDVQEDYGWKLIHAEVFRSPKWSVLLSVLVGNGAQLTAMVAVTLVFALFGFLSPSNRGSLATVMLICWTLFGVIGGYVATRTYLTISDGSERKKMVFLTAVLLPTFVFAMMFLLNLVLIAQGAAGAVPFGTLLVIVLLWFVVNGPLVSIGAYFGTKHRGLPATLRVNPIPRQIPPPPKYLKPLPSILITGALPFGAAFIEGYFILSSIFASRAYYAFGFLAVDMLIVGIATASVTILFVYFLLCAEDYRWQWRSFLAGGGSAVWVIIYGVWYWLSRMSLDSFSSFALYFGYLFLFAVFNFIISGSIGFLASYFAIRRLYFAIRID